MNISELARRLRANPDELREKLPQLGFDVGLRAIKVDDRLVNKIMEKWSEMKKTERLKVKYQREEKLREAAVAQTKEVELPALVSVRDFAAKLSLPLNMVIGELMKNGILASVNERIDFTTASVVAEDLGFKVTQEADDKSSEGGMSADELKTMLGAEEAHLLKPRPPVVVVMGHVDHGKTSLLDAIRSETVAKGEAGGITQHIGAYQVVRKDRKITFIDTPGHEAFTVMRSRGARVADIAILVVAADDGVQPQTAEVIKIIDAAKLPYVVALNKMDKSSVDAKTILHVKTQLSEKGIIPEDFGGTAVLVPVSAKTGMGLEQLLDMVLLTADIDPERVKANPDRKAVGTVIESHVDKGEGPVATLLVQSGTLRRNDHLAINDQLYGRVRAMKDWNGKLVEKAEPGMPVKIIGFKVSPQVGDIAQVPENADSMKKVDKQYTVEKQSTVVAATSTTNEEDGTDRKFLNIMLKADSLGSLEAVVGSIEKFNTPEVGIKFVGRGLGNVSESDVTRAETTGGIVLAFNVKSTREADLLARDKKVDIKVSKIIYELFDEVKVRMQALVPAEIIRTDIGKLEVLAVFRSDKNGQVIGGRCIDGHIEKGAHAVMYRGEEPVDDGKVLKLQSGKQEVKEIRMGQECGVQFSARRPALVGDVVHFFTEERKEKKLVFPA